MASRLILVMALVLLGGCRAEDEGSVTIFAAASVAPALEHIFADQPEIRINAASSGNLARQISLGAEADLFVSADPLWVRHLRERGHGGEVFTLADNTLVLIAPAADPPATFEGLVAGEQRIAVGDPESVPAGRYARAVLERRGAWEALQGRLVFGFDVRQVLLLVQRGEVDGGFVYASDAAGAEGVQVVERFTPEETGPIAYEALVLDAAATERVRARLGSAEARAALASFGLKSQLLRDE